MQYFMRKCIYIAQCLWYNISVNQRGTPRTSRKENRMGWFYDTFLPSLFARAGAEKGMWLSKKQTDVCTRYMEKHSVLHAQFQGDYTTHLYYTCKWGERDVHLSYSKLNGCGMITFSFDSAEREEATRAAQEERERIERERIERVKRRPERLAKIIAELTAKLERAIEYYDDDVEDGVDTDTLQHDMEWIESCRAELAKYQ